jgi:GNAT superfamily N-acetyltransferase
MSAYEISTDSARLDVDAIHAFITRSYWSPGIPRATVARAIANSLCFGAFWQGQQVGFARVVTDRTTFAYLCDVYVLEAHRGHGLAKQLMDRVMKHPDLQGLRRMMLATLDAHGLYAQFGFTALGAPDRIMEVLKPDIYSKG